MNAEQRRMDDIRRAAEVYIGSDMDDTAKLAFADAVLRVLRIPQFVEAAAHFDQEEARLEALARTAMLDAEVAAWTVRHE